MSTNIKADLSATNLIAVKCRMVLYVVFGMMTSGAVYVCAPLFKVVGYHACGLGLEIDHVCFPALF